MKPATPKLTLRMISAEGIQYGIIVKETQSFFSISERLENIYTKDTKFLINGTQMNMCPETFVSLNLTGVVDVDVIENLSGG